jgi:hypothetical protein
MTRRMAVAALFLVASSVFAEPVLVSRSPFRLRIVDAYTGQGVPNLKITTDNGIVCYTLLDGTAAFGEASLMGRSVRFHVADDAHRFHSVDTTIRVARRTQTTVVVTAR